MKKFTKITAIATTTLSLLALLSAPAYAVETPKIQREAVTLPEPVKAQKPVTALSTAKVTFARTNVKSEAAPKKETPVIVQSLPQDQTVTQPVQQTTNTQSGPEYSTLKVPLQTPARQLPKPELATSSRGQAIVSAALAQLGVNQDCTALVENSLRAAGVAGVGDESPASALRFGTPVSSPQPGDLIYYADGGVGVPHIAVALNSTQAIHGGYLGYTTKVAPIYMGSGISFYRVS